jgi:large subunit ribosomal protein L9
MKLLVKLLKPVKGLGNAGTFAEVAPSYANNVLLKQWLAKLANKAEIDNQKKHDQAVVKHKQHADESLLSLVQHIRDQWWRTLHQKCNDQGKMFASLDSKKIAALLHTEHGVDVDARIVTLWISKIDTLGSYDVTLHIWWKAHIFTLHVLSV